MQILSTIGWTDYQLLDTGDQRRLERFGKYLLDRPDPQAIWQKKHPDFWPKADAVFVSDKNNKGFWQKNSVPEKWIISYQDLRFFGKLSPFKHTGIFGEQVLNWQWLQEKLASWQKPLKILNLFAYTGIASLVCAKENAFVTHVDSSFPTIAWAKENASLSKIPSDKIRWINEDASKFVEREKRRNSVYDGIIMDPPVYGHGPNKEVWDFPKHFPKLLQTCIDILSPNPLFVLVNTYAVSSSAIMLNNLFLDHFSNTQGKTEYGELAIQEADSERLLSTGIFARWSR